MSLSYAIVRRSSGDNVTRYAVWKSLNRCATREYLQDDGADALFTDLKLARRAMNAWLDQDNKRAKA
jgi:hypothetical protein